MAKMQGYKSDVTDEPIPDGERVQGRVTFIYPGGVRREARFDLRAGEEEQVDVKALQFVDAKAPGPAKGTVVKRVQRRSPTRGR